MKLNIMNTDFSAILIIRRLFLGLTLLLLVSCDPTLDSLSYDLPDEGDIQDEVLPTASYTYTIANELFTEDNENFFYQVTFANSSSNGSVYEWDFGDGEVGYTGFSPKIYQDDDGKDLNGLYLYPQSEEVATYTVTLTVSDNNGEVRVYSEDIVITPSGDFEVPFSEYASYTLINTTADDNPVKVDSFSSYQVEKDAFASNTIDNDLGTLWTTEDTATDGEYVIFDLGSDYALSLIRISFTAKDNPYGYQILTSMTGIDDADFSVVLPASGGSDLEFTVGNGELADFDIDATARYVKLVVYGRFDVNDTSVKKSNWTNVSEIKFYSDKE